MYICIMNVSSMYKKHKAEAMKVCISLIMSICFGCALSAQVEVSDSIAMKDTVSDIVLQDRISTIPQHNNAAYRFTPTVKENKLGMDYSTIHIDGFRSIRGIAPVASWNGGGVYAEGGYESLPGLMNIDNGAVNVYQRFGSITATAYGEAVKYGYFNGLITTWGYGGSISYRISDNLSITGFGGYSTASGGFFSPAMSGYVGTTNFGGYLDYRISSKFGVKAGAQTYRSIMDNSWHTQPMVVPYFRLGGNDIGIDVGGILYNIFVNANGGKRSNPTIAPPRLKDMH